MCGVATGNSGILSTGIWGKQAYISVGEACAENTEDMSLRVIAERQELHKVCAYGLFNLWWCGSG